jgi:ribosomal protein L28
MEWKSPSRSALVANLLPQISRSLSYDDSYACPICGQGTLFGMTLMDAYACNACRHLFTANLTEQILRVEDNATPMAWRWSGTRWRSVQAANQDLTLLVWICCIAIMFVPPAIVWVPAQIFPPLEGSKAAWFPDVWFVAIVVGHVSIGTWLLAEHYQWQPYIVNRERLNRLFARN